MKYFISYDAVEDVVSVRDVRPELSVDADYDEDYGLYPRHCKRKLLTLVM